ncbi:MAG: hypothetical protein FRX49_03058 [Trebouxia sp. A1-2]|nr:MAG: hypothetical protein FRX49_03058 [Trebouxia sp. A1-2]
MAMYGLVRSGCVKPQFSNKKTPQYKINQHLNGMQSCLRDLLYFRMILSHCAPEAEGVATRPLPVPRLPAAFLPEDDPPAALLARGVGEDRRWAACRLRDGCAFLLASAAEVVHTLLAAVSIHDTLDVLLGLRLGLPLGNSRWISRLGDQLLQLSFSISGIKQGLDPRDNRL